ncbi:bifunctional phosphopantothenoylcysteine decarboxylase/phosphopantothenate--cysteine ligase CoaBC [Anaerococcus porci]|uniref:bifunctional phosphopantothenoylcysteine decarboxylase/phosphopantothenate--cysteine ligase CoaBC n=1 Tax=Anaerococcus porci TaxID=2652269 RepID=UPI002A764B5E|nr:bifunctional phosphopantothenoylcysteine decarboxylase/phosphopantothenate--cysteine ligase CoaBC [Anaerococcus porci]MDY3005795.1 bifunctional phosphopantothenoylcysteine decarboxylase/phosphopantothenate--cysteine ligase CoaBC [Anaerococcus porci]
MIKGKNILLGVSGGIATYKVLDLCSRLKKEGANLKIIMTEGACKFVTPLSFETMGKCKVYSDMFEGHHDKVHHIELPKWADVFLIAPLTANTLAKMTYGIADNMLTASILACDKDIIVAPTMNTNMLNHPVTQKNLKTIEDKGVYIINPSSGMLACNTRGDGRMQEPVNIVKYLDYYFTKKDLNGKKIIVTAGPTVEKIDYVRYITNKSSGKMGYNIAYEAFKRGADVKLISGPVSPFEVDCVDKVNVNTNKELKDEIDKEFDDADALIMAAAPTDYKVEKPSDVKIKKDGNNLNLELIENIDILKYFGDKKNQQTLIGFAAETDDLINNAQKKLEAKKVDYIIANDLKKKGAGFDVDTNIASILSHKSIEKLNMMTKRELANKILDLLV